MPILSKAHTTKQLQTTFKNSFHKLPVYRNYHFFESGRAPVKRRYCYWLVHITLFEDGTGQHAVDMQMEFGGLGLRYVLFYDKLNVRTKAVKIKWHYQS